MKITKVKKNLITRNLGILGHFFVVEHKISYINKDERKKTRVLNKSFDDINKALDYYYNANKFILFLKFLIKGDN